MSTTDFEIVTMNCGNTDERTVNKKTPSGEVGWSSFSSGRQPVTEALEQVEADIDKEG